MLGAFILLISMGTFYCSILLFVIYACIFSEIVSLKRNVQKEIDIPYFNFLNWYFFFVAVFYFIGKMTFEHKLTQFVV